MHASVNNINRGNNHETITPPPPTKSEVIELLLHDGSPVGVRSAVMKGHTIKVSLVPKKHFKDFSEMPENEEKQAGVYFLVEEDEQDQSRSRVYVGQTMSVSTRLKHHLSSGEDFSWNLAIIVTSLRVGEMTPTHAMFLERRSIDELKEAGRFSLTNDRGGNSPQLSVADKSTCQTFFEDADLIMSALGFPFFTPLVEEREIDDRRNTDWEDDIFYCNGRKARMRYTSEGCVVLKGSVAVEKQPATPDPQAERIRSELLDSGVLKEVDGNLTFVKNELFKNPNRAGRAVLRRACSAPLEWRRKDGKTFGEIYPD